MAKEKKDEEKEGKEEGKEGAEAAPAPKKGKKKLFIIVGAVLLLAAAAGVPLMMMGGSKDKDKDAKQEEQAPAKQILTASLDTFIVNLSESGAFLKVKMLFEYDGAIIHKAEEDMAKKGIVAGGGEGKGEGGGAGLTGYLKLREPMIRDTVIKILSSKRSSEVLSQDGKEKLKEELIEGLNEALGLDEGPVQSIYFAEFIIQ